jgi:PAS domain S-box-containing protein
VSHARGETEADDSSEAIATNAVRWSRSSQDMLLEQIAGVLDGHALDNCDVFTCVARLLVPGVADLALIDVVGPDGTPQRVAAAHVADPLIAAVLEESAADLNDGVDATTLVVLRTGTPILRERCEPSRFEHFLATADLSDVQRQTLLRLRPCSYLAIPLTCRGRCLGVISLVHTEVSQRHFGGDDLRWLHQVAARIAVDLELVRLERLAQKTAGQLRPLELELEHARQLEKAIVDSVSEPLVVLDTLGRMRRLNAYAERSLGHRAHQLLGQPFWQQVPTVEVAAVRATLDMVYAEGGAQKATSHWLAADGDRSLVRWTFQPLFAADGTVAYVVAAGDLSEEIAGKSSAGLAAECFDQVRGLMDALSECESAGDAAVTALAHAEQTLAARAGVVMQLEANTRELVCIATYGVIAVEQRVALSHPVPLVSAARTGEPVFLESPEDSLRAGYARRASDLQAGYGAWAVVPLAAYGQVIGALELSFDGSRSFGADDRAFLLVLATLCAQAIHRSRAQQALPLGRTVPVLDLVSARPEANLSVRERQVLQLLVEGLSQRQIADKLGVATVTVKTHVDHLCDKLEVSGSARSRGLAARAMRLGLVSATAEPVRVLRKEDVDPQRNPLERGWLAPAFDVTLEAHQLSV